MQVRIRVPFEDGWKKKEKGFEISYQMFVGRPSSNGQDVPHGHDILKPNLFQPAFEQRSDARFQTRFPRGVEEDGVEMFGGVVGGEGAVRGPPFHVEIDAFEVAARLKIARWSFESVNLNLVCGLGLKGFGEHFISLIF